MLIQFQVSASCCIIMYCICVYFTAAAEIRKYNAYVYVSVHPLPLFSFLYLFSCLSIPFTLFPSFSPPFLPPFHSPSYHKQVCYISQCPSTQDRIVPVQNRPESITYRLDRLNPGTTYNIRVTASTRAGEGPPVTVTNMTTFEGECSK